MRSLALAIGACALASPVVAQDLFQRETKFLAQPGVAMKTVNENETSLMAHVAVASANTWYKTITPDGLNLCLDAPGGTAYNGNMLWLWDCNGLDAQIWVFDANNQIRFGADEHFCIDARDMTNGVQLMLWECNDLPQQSWAWDGDAKNIFIKDTATCLDLWDQDDGTRGWKGQELHVWECNGLGNQQWNLRDSADPSGPFPSPSPSPSAGGDYFDSCSDKSGGDWPSFSDQSSLQSDSKWSVYFKLVYGEIPSSGYYPICLSGFRMLHLDALQSAGISPKQVPFSEYTDIQMGDYFVYTDILGLPAGYIYHGRFCSGQCFGSNQWVEGLHCGSPTETGSAWYFFGTGSGVWIYSGSTKAYPERQDFQKDMGFSQSDCSVGFECGGELFKTAKSQHGYDTIQYISVSSKYPPEFISTTGVGSYTCGASQTPWKAGWAAHSDCNCDQSLNCQNCQGFASPGCAQTMVAV